MILIAISFTVRKENCGRNPQKIFCTTPFQSKENALFDIKRVLHTGHFRSFTEVGRHPDPLDPPSCAPG